MDVYDFSKKIVSKYFYLGEKGEEGYVYIKKANGKVEDERIGPFCECQGFTLRVTDNFIHKENIQFSLFEKEGYTPLIEWKEIDKEDFDEAVLMARIQLTNLIL